MDSLEALIKAKIPCEETGIRICHTVCAICSPANNCGVNAYVRDGRMVKLEGMDEHPQSKGRMCVKGLSGRQFAYREPGLKKKQNVLRARLNVPKECSLTRSS